MADIKLFVCCHKQADIPNHPLLVPIQVGAALTVERFSGFIPDNAGENISQKNRSYCELTAQYYAWKNVDADYYGFFHYRRFLYPNTKTKRPYKIAEAADSETLQNLGFSILDALIPRYDLIAPMGENMHVPVRDHYANAPHHRSKDLELLECIVRERHPEMRGAMEAYLSGTVCYFGNIYIMSREVFHDYCAWLFPILEEFDRRADTSGYTAQELRVDGYLAERLFGIFYTHHKPRLRTLELPGVHFHPGGAGLKRRLLGALLPPGSKRRSFVKRFVS